MQRKSIILNGIICWLLIIGLSGPFAWAETTEAVWAVQLGAYLNRTNAENLVREFAEVGEDVYIDVLDSKGGRKWHVVRLGGFSSREDAETARSRLISLLPDIRVRPIVISTTSESHSHLPQTELTLAESSDADAYTIVSDAEDDGAATGATDFKEPETNNQEIPAAVSAVGGPAGKTDSEQSSETVSGHPSAADVQVEAGEPEPEVLEAEFEEESLSFQSDFDMDEEPLAFAGTEELIQDIPPESGTVKQLTDRIQELENQMQSLLDADEIRNQLSQTEEERNEEEEDLLNGAGRQYTLMRTGTIGLEYEFSYLYYAYDSIEESDTIEHNANHTFTNTFTIEYPLLDNLTLDAQFPFVYEYDEVGSGDAIHVEDFGDVRFGSKWQPIKAGGKLPSIICSTTLTCPMGRSPYDINPDTELSTGSGGYSIDFGMSFSKTFDPIMGYGGLTYSYKFPIKNLDYKISSYTMDEYERGDSIGFNLGFGYSLSYNTSFTFGYQYSYSMESKRHFEELSTQTYGTSSSSSISMGSTWRLSSRYRLSLNLSIGLANSNYFELSTRIPLEFNL